MMCGDAAAADSSDTRIEHGRVRAVVTRAAERLGMQSLLSNLGTEGLGQNVDGLQRCHSDSFVKEFGGNTARRVEMVQEMNISG